MARATEMVKRIISKIYPGERHRRIAEQAQKTTQPVRPEGVTMPPTNGQPQLTLMEPDGILPINGQQTPPIQ